LALGIAAACGGSSGSPAPAPQPSPAPTAAPTTEPDPTPSPEPTPTPTPEPTPTPTPTASPSPAPGGAGVAVSLARVDAAAECDGLVPGSAPTAVTLAEPMAAGAECLGATGDGAGRVAIGVRDGDAVTWTVFGPDGSRAGQASAAGLDVLARQPDGWHGVTAAPLFSPFQESEHVWISGAGEIAARTAIEPPAGWLVNDARLAADPAGGSAVYAAMTEVGGLHASRTFALRFDPSGAPVHPAREVAGDPGPTVAFLGAGVSRRGETIVTQRVPGTLVWRWIGRDGSLLDAGSALQADVAAADPVHVEPLLDGSVALRFGGAWSAVIAHLGDGAAPAPAWLASRPGTTLRSTRGNRGYAVLPPPGEALPACEQVVELRAPSGRLCGRVSLREGDGSCTGGVVEQGWDGSLIQQAPREACAAGECACTVRVWPRLLAAP